MSIDSEIAKAVHRPFRRAYIRRRSNTTGFYESGWHEITKYVVRWGSISRSMDDQRLNRFLQSGFNLTVRNNTGAFNPEDNANSLWYGYMTRYRTLLKVEGGYFDDQQNELPTNPTLGIFVMNEEIGISGSRNTAAIRARSIVSVFDEVRAADVAGLGTTQTASQLVTKIRDHTDGSGNFYFQQFVSAGAWTINSTTNFYNLATSTAVGDLSCWDFMGKLAEAEGFVLFGNRSGGIEFRSREERTTTSQFSFLGLGSRKANVIELQEYKEAINKLYTFFRLQYLEPDTSTSFVTAGSTSTVDPSSTAWKYGSRVYEFKTTFLSDTATAQAIVNALNAEFSVIKDEVMIKTKFIPHLEVLDHTTLSYRTAEINESSALWEGSSWDDADWDSESGENFNWSNIAFKVISINTDLESFSSVFKLSEI